MGTKPVIDYKKCKNSRICMQVCPMEVFSLEAEKTIVAKPEACIGCRACEVQCPVGAIKIVEE